jgi:hypothetical protein
VWACRNFGDMDTKELVSDPHTIYRIETVLFDESLQVKLYEAMSKYSVVEKQ